MIEQSHDVLIRSKASARSWPGLLL